MRYRLTYIYDTWNSGDKTPRLGEEIEEFETLEAAKDHFSGIIEDESDVTMLILSEADTGIIIMRYRGGW